MKGVVILFVILVLFVFLTNKNSVTFVADSVASLEPFTPHLRGIYRPHLRSINNLKEHYTNKYGLQVNNLLRKYNIF